MTRTRTPATVTRGEPWFTEGDEPMKYRHVRRVAADHVLAVQREALAALHKLRREGWDIGPLPGDELSDAPGSTKRGVPLDYDGSDPWLCNARTKSGRPCRAMALAHGRCKWHGGLSTGPRTPEGKAKSALNLVKARAVLAARRANSRSTTRGHE